MARCRDHRCSDGLTMCVGCNGWGVLTMGGRKYRLRSGGRNIGTTAIAHADCSGTGMMVCGCTVLAPADLLVFTAKLGSE